MQTRKKSVTVKSGYRLKVEKTNYEFAYAERLRESEINFVFCEWELYVGTAPEQKTESAKNGKDSMSLPFFQSLRVQQVAPTSLCKGGKEVYFLYLARFSRFIEVSILN